MLILSPTFWRNLLSSFGLRKHSMVSQQAYYIPLNKTAGLPLISLLESLLVIHHWVWISAVEMKRPWSSAKHHIFMKFAEVAKWVSPHVFFTSIQKFQNTKQPPKNSFLPSFYRLHVLRDQTNGERLNYNWSFLCAFSFISKSRFAESLGIHLKIKTHD